MGASLQVCDVCDDTGWAPAPGPGPRRVTNCTTCDYWAKKRGYAPGVPDEERATSLMTYGQGYQKTKANVEALKHAQLFVTGIHGGLYLYGGVGCGKTAIACGILNDIWRAGERVRFLRVTDLLNRLLPGSDSMDEVFNQAVQVPVLCLDDVGASQGTDFARRQLQAVFDNRLALGYRTLWTSNLNLDELTEFLAEDKRLSSRIAGECYVQEVDGPDYRIQKMIRRQAKLV